MEKVSFTRIFQGKISNEQQSSFVSVSVSVPDKSGKLKRDTERANLFKDNLLRLELECISDPDFGLFFDLMRV